MATSLVSSLAVPGTRMKRECVHGTGPSRSIVYLPVSRVVASGNGVCGLRHSQRRSGISWIGPTSFKCMQACTRRQALLQALTDDGDLPLPPNNPLQALQYDLPDPKEQLAAAEELTAESDTPTENSRGRQDEVLEASESNSLPDSPPGDPEYEGRNPQTQKQSEGEGIRIEDARLSPLGENPRDLETNQRRGWSESSCDDGATWFGNSPAAILKLSTSESSEALIDRLLECLPIYNQGQTKENYRIRAVVYGKIAEYFTRGEVRNYGSFAEEENVADEKMVTAMQQLADLFLAEDGRSAADYHGRAKFFQNSAEVFSFHDAGSRSGRVSEIGEQKMERFLQQLEDVMLSDSGRSIADYNRRANVFGKTADALSPGRSEVAAASE